MKVFFISFILPISFAYAEAATTISDGSLLEYQSEQHALPENALMMPTPQFQPPPHRSALLAGSLSSLVPGLGHVYLGDMQTAGGFFGSTSLGVSLALSPHTSDTTRMYSLLTVSNIGMYSTYAAYRDARLFNHLSGYCYKMPINSLKELVYAPFKLSILKKPEVWGGLLGALTIGLGISAYFASQEARIIPTLSIDDSIGPIFALPIGIGEESFFRGYLQSGLSEILSPVGGIIASSLAFGAAHIPNALLLEPEDRNRYYYTSLPFITLLGGYLGWLTYKNHSLQESVALHTLYDMTLFSIAALGAETAIRGEPSFAVNFSF